MYFCCIIFFQTKYLNDICIVYTYKTSQFELVLFQIADIIPSSQRPPNTFAAKEKM